MKAIDAREIANKKNDELEAQAKAEMEQFAEEVIYPTVKSLCTIGKYKADFFLPHPKDRSWQTSDLLNKLVEDGYTTDYSYRTYCLTIAW